MKIKINIKKKGLSIPNHIVAHERKKLLLSFSMRSSSSLQSWRNEEKLWLWTIHHTTQRRSHTHSREKKKTTTSSSSLCCVCFEARCFFCAMHSCEWLSGLWKRKIGGRRRKYSSDFYFEIIIRFRTNSCFSDFFEILRLEKVVVVLLTFFFVLFLFLFTTFFDQEEFFFVFRGKFCGFSLWVFSKCWNVF